MNLIHRLLYPRWQLHIQVRNIWVHIGYYYFKAKACRIGWDLLIANPKAQAWRVLDDETGNLYDWGPK